MDVQTLDLLERDFKSAIVNMFKHLMEAMSYELKVSMRTMAHEIENIIKEIEIVLKIPTRNSGAQKYINCNEKVTKESLQKLELV